MGDSSAMSARRQAVAALAASIAAASATPARADVPAPPSVKWVKGVAPGTPEGVMSPAQTDIATGTVYYTQLLDKFDRAHETGHVLDGQVLNDGDRRFFQRLMHAPAGEWDQGSAADTGGGPSEWFADYYAAAAQNLDPRHGSLGNYAQIGPKRLRRFDAALRRLGKRHNLKPYTG